MRVSGGSSVRVRSCFDGKDGMTVAQEEKMRLDLVLKRQLPGLHRKYRKVQEDACENRIKLNRCASQNKVIHQLKDEKRNLLLILHQMNKHTAQMRDELGPTRKKATAVDEVMDIFHRQSSLVSDCETMLQDICFYVDHIIRTVFKYRVRMLKMTDKSRTHEEKEKLVNRLENQLYHSTVKFNSVSTTIANMREEIDSYLRDRKYFFRRNHVLKTRIHWAKHEMYTIVAKANHCYNRYDDYRTSLANLKKRNEVECGNFVADLKDKIRFLKEDRLLGAFYNVKYRHRDPLEISGNRDRKFVQTQVDSLAKIISTYRHAFKAIADTAGTPDVEATRTIYIQRDMSNFQMFCNVAHLEAAARALNDEIKAIKNKIIGTQEHYFHLKQQDLLKLHVAKQRHVHLSTEQAHVTRLHADSTATIEWLTREIGTVFKSAGCEETGIFMFLGRKKGDRMGPESLLTYLKVLENRVMLLFRRKEILLRRQVYGMKGNKAAQLPRFIQALGADKSRRGGPFRPAILLTPGMDGGNMEDEDRLFSRRPFRYEELKEICRELVDQATKLIKAMTNDSGDEDENVASPSLSLQSSRRSSPPLEAALEK